MFLSLFETRSKFLIRWRLTRMSEDIFSKKKFFHYNKFLCSFSLWFVSSWLHEYYSSRTLNAFLNRLLNATSNIDPETSIFYSKAKNFVAIIWEFVLDSAFRFVWCQFAEFPMRNACEINIWFNCIPITKFHCLPIQNVWRSLEDLFNILEKFTFLMFPSYSIRSSTRITSIIMSSIHAACHADYMIQTYHMINSETFWTKI